MAAGPLGHPRLGGLRTGAARVPGPNRGRCVVGLEAETDGPGAARLRRPPVPRRRRSGPLDPPNGQAGRRPPARAGGCGREAAHLPRSLRAGWRALSQRRVRGGPGCGPAFHLARSAGAFDGRFATSIARDAGRPTAASPPQGSSSPVSPGPPFLMRGRTVCRDRSGDALATCRSPRAAPAGRPRRRGRNGPPARPALRLPRKPGAAPGPVAGRPEAWRAPAPGCGALPRLRSPRGATARGRSGSRRAAGAGRGARPPWSGAGPIGARTAEPGCRSLGAKGSPSRGGLPACGAGSQRRASFPLRTGALSRGARLCRGGAAEEPGALRIGARPALGGIGRPGRAWRCRRAWALTHSGRMRPVGPRPRGRHDRGPAPSRHAATLRPAARVPSAQGAGRSVQPTPPGCRVAVLSPQRWRRVAGSRPPLRARGLPPHSGGRHRSGTQPSARSGRRPCPVGARR